MKADRILEAALALGFVAFCGTLYSSLHETIVNAGDKAPDFTITSDSGKTITVHEFGGKLLLLNFWATWCPPCVEEIPGLNQLARQLGPRGLVILGVSVDKDESLYRNFLTRSPLAYQTARDPEEKINLTYGTIQYPESYLIDRNGKVIEKFISSQPWASPQMIEHVNSLL
jgi:peroxiredoxin